MRSRTRSSIVLLTLFVCLGIAACGDDSDGDGGDASAPSAGDAATVQVDDNLFEPEDIAIGVDATVTWEWVGTEPHNVVGDDFESEIQQDGTFEHTFAESGSFEYVCTVHPGMKGTVEVSS